MFEDYHCLLNQIDAKSDKFYLIQLLKNDDGYFVWTRWGKNVKIICFLLYMYTFMHCIIFILHYIIYCKIQ